MILTFPLYAMTLSEAKPLSKSITPSIYIKKVSTENNDIFSEDELAPYYQSYLGKEATFDDLREMCEALTKHLQKQGYTLSKVILPKQKVKDGEVKVLFVHNKFGSIEAAGDYGALLTHDPFKSLEQIKSLLRSIDPIHVPTLNSLLSKLNETAGKETTLILNPQDNQDGTTSLDVTVKQVRKWPEISLFLNNYGTKNTGPYQYGGNIRYGHALLPFDEVNLSTLFAVPLKELHFVGMEYALPLYLNFTQLVLNGSVSNTAPGQDLSLINLQSQTSTGSIGIYHSFTGLKAKCIFMKADFGFMNTESKILSQPYYNDRVRPLRLLLGGDLPDAYGNTSLSARVSQGIRGLNASKSNSNLSRENAKIDFQKFEIDFKRLLVLTDVFHTHFSFYGQYTNNSLIAGEELCFGGALFGRGFSPSRYTGDSGVLGVWELRYTAEIPYIDVVTQGFSFCDFGLLYNNKTKSDKRITASSVGLGVRLLKTGLFLSEFNFAFPLSAKIKNYTDDKSANHARNNDFRFIFQIRTALN